MKLIFAVKDQAAEAFGLPFFVNTRGEAMRSFTDEANSNEPNSAIGRHPEDYELWHIGEYDEVKGIVTMIQNPERLARARDLVQPEK